MLPENIGHLINGPVGSREHNNPLIIQSTLQKAPDNHLVSMFLLSPEHNCLEIVVNQEFLQSIPGHFYVKDTKITSYSADNSRVMLMKRLMSDVQPFKGMRKTKDRATGSQGLRIT